MKEQVSKIKKLNALTAQRRAYHFAYRTMIGQPNEAPVGCYPISVKHWDELTEYVVKLRSGLKQPKFQIRYEGADKPQPTYDAAKIAMEATDPSGNVVRLSFVPTK